MLPTGKFDTTIGNHLASIHCRIEAGIGFKGNILIEAEGAAESGAGPALNHQPGISSRIGIANQAERSGPGQIRPETREPLRLGCKQIAGHQGGRAVHGQSSPAGIVADDVILPLHRQDGTVVQRGGGQIPAPFIRLAGDYARC